MGLEASGGKEKDHKHSCIYMCVYIRAMICRYMELIAFLYFFSHYFITLFVSSLLSDDRATHESGIAAIASISIKKAPGNFPTSTAVRAGFGDGSIAEYTPFMAV
jgi:hypothetical protein